MYLNANTKYCRLTIQYLNTNTKYFSAILVNTKYKYCTLTMCLNTFQNTFPKNKKRMNQTEFWKSKNTTRHSFSSKPTFKISKKVKINKVADTSLLFRRQLCSALFVIYCEEQVYLKYKVQTLVVKSI